MDIYIVSGFTGSGKTTFLNRYLPLFSGKNAVIENELGEVSLDVSLFEDKNVMSELPAGCICCTLASDLRKKLVELEQEYHADRIFIEPSGVGKLSDIIKVCRNVKEEMSIGEIRKITILDVSVFEGFLEDFGEFYTDQIIYADTILLSFTDEISGKEKERAVGRIKELNPDAILCEEDWRIWSDEELLAFMNQRVSGGKEPEETDVKTNLTAQGIRNKKFKYQIKNRRM